MAEEQPSLHIDTDWKKQAQDEKANSPSRSRRKPPRRRQPRRQVQRPAAGRAAAGGRGGAREMPPASLATLVNTLLTQALFYLGELAPQGGEPVVNLDMAKHQIDTLSLLEDKTRGNLTEEEAKILDTALYKARMRYVNVASQYV